MNKIIICLLTFVLFTNSVFAECDFKTGIVPGPNKTFIYTEECHQKVGKLVQDNAIKDAQIQDLTKAIQLKDLALQTSDSRIALWQKSSLDEQDRLSKMEIDQKGNEYFIFALGVLATVGAGYVASQIYRH